MKNPMIAIVSLAFCLSLGILLVILSSALYSNWLPLLVVLTYVLAPIPNIVCKRLAGSSDFLSEENRGILETGYFITSFFVVSGFALPLVLSHSGMISSVAMYLSLGGGLLIYATILGYLHFFVAQHWGEMEEFIGGDISHNAAPAHASPFFLFKTFYKSVQLEDNKYHFKTYARSFTVESATTTLTSALSCSRDDAIDYLTKFLQGGLIWDLEKPKDSFELKPKHVYGLSLKGDHILKDINSSRVPAESPEVGYASEIAVSGPNKSVSAIIRSNVIYIDRDNGGEVKLGPTVTELIFKAMMGDKPNLGSRKSSDSEGTDGTAPTHPQSRSGSVANLNSPDSGSSSGPTPIKSLQLHTRIIRLKSQPYTFTGPEVIDWIISHTTALSRDEALQVASSFLSLGWIHVAGSSHNSNANATLDGGSSSSTFKDTKSAVYQPTHVGCKLARWPVELDGKKRLSPMKGDFENNEEEGGNGLSPISIITPNGDESPSLSPSKSTSNRTSAYYGAKLSEAGTIDASSPSARPSSPSALESAAFEWETCHLNPISMDGSESRAGARSPSITGKESVTVTAATLAAAARNKRASTLGARKTSVSGGSPVRRGSEVGKPAGNVATSPDGNPFSVDQIKESNPTRLVSILTSEELRASFHIFVRSMFCEENLYFWEDVHAFRTSYSSSPVVPGQALTPETTPKEHPMLIPHAMALYLKYVYNDAPFELNLVIGIKKQIEAAILKTTEFMQYINPDSIASEEKIEPSQILVVRNGSQDEAMSKFPSTIPGFSASMFDAAEHHIFHLMANDSVPKFIKTKMYADNMSELFSSGKIMWRGPVSLGLLRRRSIDGTTDTLAGVAAGEVGASGRRRSSSTQQKNTNNADEGKDGERLEVINDEHVPAAELGKVATDAVVTPSIAIDKIESKVRAEVNQQAQLDLGVDRLPASR
ncbi:Vacuolar protein sorting-associated protein 55 [Phlyctochytrium planicorne]|nr:Vacuolar protein sorting-associated protein 55 [Phlyctochytrium planicorne]